MKFKFTTDFQLDLLKFTVLDKAGYKALELYDDSYFTLTEHAVIAYTLKNYYKRRKTIPGKTILIEELIKTFDHREFVNNLVDDDRKMILVITEGLFKGIVQDGDEILASTEKFAQYVDLKYEVENINLLDYEQYDVFSRKIQKAIAPRLQSIEERGSFLVKDVRSRQIKRKEGGSIVSMPWKQLNRLTNADGYARNSIMVILDAAKEFKTGVLVNIARQYLKGLKKKILVIDLDNGEDEWMMRVEQCLLKVTKKELLNSENNLDKKLRGLLKRYKKLRGELIVKRMPALITTAADIDSYIDYLYREYGIRIEILIIDYLAKMGCISGKDSLHERISEAYIDMGNLALKRDLDLIWTAQHVTRDAVRARGKKIYEPTDVAGAIDITRHVQAIFGLNRTPREEANGFQRLEIVAQRDGPPHGHVVFHIDREKQRLEPLKYSELQGYYRDCRPKKDPEDNSYEGSRENNKKRGDLDNGT